MKKERDIYLRIAGHIQVLCQRQVDLRKPISEINLEEAVNRVVGVRHEGSKQMIAEGYNEDERAC